MIVVVICACLFISYGVHYAMFKDCKDAGEIIVLKPRKTNQRVTNTIDN
jgi:hypothetical protein